MLKNFAQDLKNYRESKNISLNDIYFQTKIHPSNFEKLENGDFNFQPQTYIRAFLRQYARCLELDDSEVLRNYDLAKSGKYHPKSKSHEEPKVELKNTSFIEPVEEKESQESKKVLVENKTDENHQNYVVPKSTFYDEPDKNILPKILKFVGGLIIVVLIIIGVYLLAKNMFFDKQAGDKNEIIRQPDFNDVVKEQEKKMLGKRTQEEIQDSISKAQRTKDSLAAVKDSVMVLRVESKKKGRIIVIADSVNMKKREVESFDKSEYLEWKARKYFLVTSKDISAFDIKLNGKKIKFEDKAAKDFKITKQTVTQ